ncbi:tetratricopeptide repeat protein [Candidatus Neomarinimicrobiota bacterium]
MEPITIILVIAIVVIAIAMICWLRSKVSVSTEVLYSNALNAILKGENTEAVKLLKQVVGQDSDNIDAYLQLGNLLRSVNPQQASKIHQSLTVRPKLSKTISKEIHQALALDYAELSNTKRAKIEADMVLKYDKNSSWAYQFLLQIAEKHNDWEQASVLATKIQKLTGNRDVRQLAEIQLQAGNGQLDINENKKALQHYQNAIKLDPFFSAPYLQIGNIYENENNLKKAIINWEKYLINEDNGGTKIYKKIESALFDLGRFSEVDQFYLRILAEKPNDKNAIVKLANLLKDKGDINEAIALVDKAINQNNDSIPARLMKIKILLEKANPVDLYNQIDELIKIIEK